MSSDELKDLKPVYLIHGKEELLLDQAVARLQSRLAKVADIEFNMRVFDGETASADEVVESANTLPFMSDRRLVVVRHADRMPADGQSALAAYCSDPAPHACLVLVAEKVDRRSRLFKAVEALGGVSEYKAPGRGQYPGKVVEMFRDRGKRIGLDAAEVLVEAVGQDLRRLAIEADKVCAYAGDAATLSRDDVERVMSLTAPTSVWEYVDAVGSREPRLALRLLAELLAEGESVFGIWAMTVRHVRQLLTVRAMLDRGADTNAVRAAIGAQEWQVRKLLAQARRYETEELESALRLAAGTEAAMKTGRDARLAFERWVAAVLGS